MSLEDCASWLSIDLYNDGEYWKGLEAVESARIRDFAVEGVVRAFLSRGSSVFLFSFSPAHSCSHPGPIYVCLYAPWT